MALDSMATKIEPRMAGMMPADAGLQADTANHGGGDAFKHQVAAEVGFAGSGARGQHQRTERGADVGHSA